MLMAAATAYGVYQGAKDQSNQGLAARPPVDMGADVTSNKVHIAPVGVNFGAILAPFNEGSPENGGFGLDLMNRYVSDMGRLQTPLASASNIPWPWIIGGVGLVGLTLFAFL